MSLLNVKIGDLNNLHRVFDNTLKTIWIHATNFDKDKLRHVF